MPVRVDVLGPLRLTVDGREVAVPGPRRRALLAVLAMAEGRTVPTDDLIAAIWPGEIPDTARATLQSHVSRLRRHLGNAATSLEGGSTGGYRLVLDSDGTDLATARRLHETARRADSAAARNTLGEARRLWRGEALAEFPDVERLAAATISIRELRGSIDRAYVAALLDTGDIEQAVAVAADHVGSDPLSEPAVLLLMSALHADGRSAEGLRAGYAYRQRLVIETGLDPTPALTEMETQLAAIASPARGAVPRPAKRMRGRDSELAALRRLLATERLVTIVGPGGVGKTHLAMELAAGAEPATAVLLGSVTDERLLPHAIADALDLRVRHGEPLDACAAILAAGPRLLVVDNCEHLLAAVKHAAQRLLDACPDLTILATSREPLALPAEQRLRLAPLPVTRTDSLADIKRAPAVALFLDRANRLGIDLTPGPSELATISHIVRKLDGMPLAIELAAARLSSLSLDDLYGRVDHALDLLGDSPAGTLRQTIAWSYDLLPAAEQRLLRQLSMFADGIDLLDAEALAVDLDSGSIPLNELAHLVDASMLQVAPTPTTRYRMLDTVRAFAGEQLAGNAEAGAAAERFLQWALGLVHTIDATVITPEEHRADTSLRREFANLRVAWARVRTLGRTDDAVGMVLRLTDAAGWRDLTEVWDWTLELAADPGLEHHAQAPEVLGAAASSAWSRGELDRADELADAGIELTGSSNWSCIDAKSLVALSRGDLTACAELAIQAAEASPRPSQSFGIAALARGYAGDLDAARSLNKRFWDVAASPTLRAFHAYVDAEIEALAEDRDRAVTSYETAIALARSVGSTFLQGVASVGRLSQFAATGRTTDALRGYRELIDYWHRTGSWVQQWTTLRNLADVLDSLGHSEPALILRHAAAGAPDAPPAPREAPPGDLDREALERLYATAASAGRDAIVQIARDAIHHALP